MFHFKKDHAGCSIKAEDYETKPLFVSSKENRLLNELFLYVLEDLHTTQGLGFLQSDAAASPGPCAAPGGAGSGAGAATPARPPAPAVSDDEDGSDLITGGGGGDQAQSWTC